MRTPMKVALLVTGLVLLSLAASAAVTALAGGIVLIVGMLTLVPVLLGRSGEYDDEESMS